MANPLPNCFVIVGDKRTMQIKSLIDAGKNDVLSFQYIIDALNNELGNNAGIPNPSHFLGYTTETRSLFSGMFDEFGDSYTEEVNIEQLKRIFDRFDDTISSLERKKKVSLTSKKAKKLQKIDLDTTDSRVDNSLQLSMKIKNENWREILSCSLLEDDDFAQMFDGNEWNVFWRNNTVIYLDLFEDLSSCGNSTINASSNNNDFLSMMCSGISGGPSSIFRSKESVESISSTLSRSTTRLRAVISDLLLRGATLSPTLDQRVTHVVVDFDYNYSPEREKALRMRLRELRFLPDYRFEKRIVNLTWIYDCITHRKLIVPEESHLVQWRTKDM